MDKPNLPLSCTCGIVRGEAAQISPKRVLRLKCMCDDCQTYAHFLGREKEILDEWSGSEICQMMPAQVSITAGEDSLRCLRQSPKGLLRWYAGCCHTPIANQVANPKMPFIGIYRLFMESKDESQLTEMIGALAGRTQGRFSPQKDENPPANFHARASLPILWKSSGLLLRGFLKKTNARSPFRNENGQLLQEPTVMTLDERKRLREKVQTPLGP